jgi:hypothetical protein
VLQDLLQLRGDGFHQLMQIQVRHQRVVELPQQLRTVSLLPDLALGLSGALEIQSILNGNGNLRRTLLEQSCIILGKRPFAQAHNTEGSQYTVVCDQRQRATRLNAVVDRIARPGRRKCQ